MEIKSFIKSSQIAWGTEWKSRKFRWSLLGGLLFFAIFPLNAPEYFQWIQQRPGRLLDDWVLENIPAMNVSMPIFSIIYFSVLYLIGSLAPHPKRFLWFVWAFNLETLFRFACIYWVALEPPIGLVDLHDPVAEAFIYGENMPITKDLFFSGHTATMVFAAYFLPNKQSRWVALGLTLIIMALLAIQHVHYTIDILAAPLATIISIILSKKLLKSLGLF